MGCPGSPTEYTELSQGKRLFIKDIIHYLVPPNGAAPSIAPSLARKKRGIGTAQAQINGTAVSKGGPTFPYATDAEPGNPTVVPTEDLARFHFTFLIRHPRCSIPSYYRCTLPPLDELTGFSDFMPSEAGYDETRRVFDFLRSNGQIGPQVATHSQPGVHTNGESLHNPENVPDFQVEICVVDADDLLDNPKGIIEAFCQSVGLDFDEKMLSWESEEDHRQAQEAFEKWRGFHEDAMNSNNLRPRQHVCSFLFW